jgi:hypothetical protein
MPADGRRGSSRIGQNANSQHQPASSPHAARVASAHPSGLPLSTPLARLVSSTSAAITTIRPTPRRVSGWSWIASVASENEAGSPRAMSAARRNMPALGRTVTTATNSPSGGSRSQESATTTSESAQSRLAGTSRHELKKKSPAAARSAPPSEGACGSASGRERVLAAASVRREALSP